MPESRCFRRLMALLAAYAIALQTLVMPMVLASAAAAGTELCVSAGTDRGAPSQSRGDAGCGCAAGCGTMCCAQISAAPPPAGEIATRRDGVSIATPARFVSARMAALERRAHAPRGPPSA